VPQPAHRPARLCTHGQTDARIGSIEVKVKKLDGELARYKEQMAKLRNGPGKVRARRDLLHTTL
jgi:charged multivesicular body protein 5